MGYKITLCSSASFFNKLSLIRDELVSRNFIVYFPHIWDWSKNSEGEIAKVQHDLIKRHFKNINNSDAIYVANFNKSGIKNYIGGNTLLEIGKAFDRDIPIFLMHDIPDMEYKGEIRAMKPHVIGTDWDKMEKIIRSKTHKNASHHCTTTTLNHFYRTSIKALILDNKKKFLLALEDKGRWELPGGGLDFGEKPHECLTREIKEEMGLEVIHINKRPSYFVTALHTNGRWKSIVLYETKVKDFKFTPSNECIKIKFFSKEEALKENLNPIVKEFIKEYNPDHHKLV